MLDRAARYLTTAYGVLLTLVVPACSGDSTATMPSPRPAASVSVAVTAAAAERNSDGTLAYNVTFTVSESAGVAASVSTVAFTIASAGLNRVINASPNEVFAATRIAPNASITADGVVLTPASTAQPATLTVRIGYIDDNGHSGTAETTTPIAASRAE